jgi:hypothetical protein
MTDFMKRTTVQSLILDSNSSVLGTEGAGPYETRTCDGTTQLASLRTLRRRDILDDC